MFRIQCLMALLCFAGLSLYAQKKDKSFTVKFTSDFINVDGIMDEAAWETAESAADFNQYFPTDSVPAREKTAIKMLYNGSTLFIGIRADSPGKDYIVPTLRRDFRAGGNDNISLLFDTFNDGTNAFLFGINPYGVQREALISGGGADLRDFSTSWDVKWQGESRIYEDHYIVEIAIPLSSLKYREGATKWRFQSYRFDMQSNERSAWVHIPQNQLIFNLAFMGDMVFEEPLGKSTTPLALIPYANILSERDFEAGTAASTKFKAGGDAKVAIGNGMNLDVTVNPDFSNVEVDDIFTNLTRFEVSLPEKRQFFIDNSDLFGSFGDGRDANPFFSRRIGIAQDSADNSIQNKILGGIRLSGKLNQNWRLGFLNIQTASDVENQIPSNNNMMIALQKRIFSRSNLGIFFINRQSLKKYDFQQPEDVYNRVLGIDYNLASSDNVWTGKLYAHKSLQPGDPTGNFSLGSRLVYKSRKYNVLTDINYIDDDFRSDLGFILRTGIIKSVVSLERVFWPEKGFINNHGFRFSPIIIWQPQLDYKKTDHDIRMFWTAEFQDQSELELEFSNSFIYLTEPFDPTDTDGATPLPANSEFTYNGLKLDFQSNRARMLSFSLEPALGQFFSGKRFALEGEINLRLQPRALLTLAMNYDHIELPSPYPSADLWLISPKVDITFSKSLFWSTLVQYSNQRDNLGINSRLQWRFAPLSDLYLVYNDNYFVDRFAPRYRSINLKLQYWLNI